MRDPVGLAGLSCPPGLGWLSDGNGLSRSHDTTYPIATSPAPKVVVIWQALTCAISFAIKHKRPSEGALWSRQLSAPGLKVEVVVPRPCVHSQATRPSQHPQSDTSEPRSMSAEVGPVAQKPLFRVKVSQFLPGLNWNSFKLAPNRGGDLSTLVGHTRGKGVGECPE